MSGSLPSPAFNSLTLTTPLATPSGGFGATNAGTAVVSVSTIAALMAATSSTLPQAQCYVLGYYGNSDGGEGVFTVGAATAANGGTIINDASGRSWYREGVKNGVTALQFGARGNGAANDYAALSAAISAVEAMGGGTVYLPPTGAAYFIGTGLSLPNGVALVGTLSRNYEGATATIAQWTQYGTWIQSADAVNPAVMMVGHGSAVSGVNFIYAQPIPPSTGTTGYTPTIWPFSIMCEIDEANIRDIMIVAGGNGISIKYALTTSGGTGVNVENCLIDACAIGFQTYGVNDTLCVSNLHVRGLYYNINLSVTTYLESNLIGWDCEYCDNPMMNNLEFFHCYIGWKLTNQTVLGATHALYNCLISDIQFGLCNMAIYAPAGTVVTGKISNLFMQSDTETGTTGTLFNCPTDSLDLEISNFRMLAGAQGFALGNGSIGGNLSIGNLRVLEYSATVAGQVLFNVNTGFNLNIGNYNITKTGNSPGETFSGLGYDTIKVGNSTVWSPFSIADQYTYTGPLTDDMITTTWLYVPSSENKVQVRLKGTMNITTASTGTGTVQLSNYPETATTFSTATTGASAFDTNWIDIMTPNLGGVAGYIELTVPSGTTMQSGNLAAQFR